MKLYPLKITFCNTSRVNEIKNDVYNCFRLLNSVKFNFSLKTSQKNKKLKNKFN